ncbi:MAG: Cysteine desulfurase DndA [Parcubacteria group bacterium GW2011_GWA1_54_9]|nr:MAG: Cysteine desulfurase DndA [Parcubacteria group bacterium GW2011_GWA1_54_9]
MFWSNKRTYLDYAAGMSGNPSSPHKEGRKAKKMLEDARTSIARLVEVQSDDVIFTSGVTEANALAILGIVRARSHLAPRTSHPHVLYLPSAHASVVENMKLLAEEDVMVDELPIKNYRVDTEMLAKMLQAETMLVSMDAVCGETGIIWNTREVKQTIGPKMLLHVDASQAPLTEKITRAHFSADMLTLDASKVCATRGIGVLIAHRTIPLVPLYRGGGQERGLRSGSEAPGLAREFAAALRAAANGRESFRASAERVRTELIRNISTIPNVYINEGREPACAGRQAPHILNLSLIGRNTDYLVALLDEAGFAVSTRSACETDSEEGSRAVYALTGDRERARTTLRISWGPDVRSRDFGRFALALVREVVLASGGIDNGGQR